MTDPCAPLEDNSWREIAEIDARLVRGEIMRRRGMRKWPDW